MFNCGRAGLRMRESLRFVQRFISFVTCSSIVVAYHAQPLRMLCRTHSLPAKCVRVRFFAMKKMVHVPNV